MSVAYGYYLPLATNLFDSVRFIGITPKTERVNGEDKQKTNSEGVLQWSVSALVKFQEGNQETEVFTLAVPIELANKINAIEELTPIRLIGLSGGKWSKNTTDKTSWSFQISGVEVVKSQ